MEVISPECDPHSVGTTRSQVGRKDASTGFSGTIAAKKSRNDPHSSTAARSQQMNGPDLYFTTDILDCDPHPMGATRSQICRSQTLLFYKYMIPVFSRQISSALFHFCSPDRSLLLHFHHFPPFFQSFFKEMKSLFA